MISDSYQTLCREVECSFTEKKSEFISYAKPIETEEQAKEFLESVRRLHPDATHHVYAYINRQGNVSRFSDDNEPQGTAGLPVFDVLQKEGLLGVCLVVVRYFGGTLLGAGGLVRAYGRAARDAVEAAGVCRYEKMLQMQLRVSYELSGKLGRELEKLGLTVQERLFDQQVTVRFLCALTDRERVESALMDACGGRCALEQIGTCYAQGG